MSACNIYNKEHQQLLIKFFDTVTLADLQEQASLLATNKTEGSARRKCISFLSATSFDPEITLDKVQAVVETMRKSLKSVKGGKTAFVAPNQEALGVSLMFKECLKGEGKPEEAAEVKIFTTKDEAIDWLGGSKEQWRQMRDHVSRMCSL